MKILLGYLFLVISASALISCGGSNSGSSNDSGPNVPKPLTDGCSPITTSFELDSLKTRYGRSVIDSIRIGSQIVSLISQSLTDNTYQLSFLKSDGTIKDLVKVKLFSAGILRPHNSDRLCIVYVDVLGTKTIQIACDDGSNEDSKLIASNLSDGYDKIERMPSVTYPDGSLSVFTQNYASYTEIRRTAAGIWSEKEKYESSISVPQSAISYQNSAISCFTDSSDFVSIDYKNKIIKSSNKSNQCFLAEKNNVLHILTDNGYSVISDANLITKQPTFNPISKPTDLHFLDLIISNNEPYAISFKGDRFASDVFESGGEVGLFNLSTGNFQTILAVPSDETVNVNSISIDKLSNTLNIVFNSFVGSGATTKERFQINSICL